MHTSCMNVKESIVSVSFICYAGLMVNKRSSSNGTLSFDAAVGATVNQYLLIHGLTRAEIGKLLGVAGSNVSQRLRGQIGWPAHDLFALGRTFGVPVDALMPSPDGAGGWVPAPYAPGARAAGARSSAGEVVVPQAGLEPATGGL